MSLLDRPIRKNRGTMPQRFRDLEVSIEDPVSILQCTLREEPIETISTDRISQKSGAEYFQVARAAGEFEDTQVQPVGFLFLTSRNLCY
jgi:hypothetical protein